MIKDVSDLLSRSSEIRETKQEIKKVKKLVWNVIAEDHNFGTGYVNVFEYNWPFRAFVYKAYKEYKDNFDMFAKEVHSALMHEYWARSEYEVIVSAWPTGINEDEVNRLVAAVEVSKKNYPSAYHHRVYPNLEHAVKIDIYDQIIMNWDAFIAYVWENKKCITKFKDDFKTYYHRKTA